MIDWQLASSGAGTEDLARFMLLSMGVDERRDSQQAMLEAYAGGLAEGGAARPPVTIEAEVGAMTLLHLGNLTLGMPNVELSTEQGRETIASVSPRLKAAAEDFSDLESVLAPILG